MKNWRINLVILFIFLFGVAIIGRLFFIQVLEHDIYSARAKGQQKIFAKTIGERGEVFLQDKKGHLYPLAINRNWSLVYASPEEVENKPAIAKKIAEVLNLEEDVILEKLKQKGLYILLKTNITEEEEVNFKKLDIPGVYLGKERGREYPQAELASSIIGFLSSDGLGQYGIEGHQDELLRGEEGFTEWEKGPSGFLVFSNQGENAAKKGSDLILTLDYNIQYQSEKLLNKAKEQFDIEGGTVIVMEPNSGKILALANFPNFNPNQYSEEEDLEIFQNSAIQKIFEPGSVFKAITMAAALNEGKVTPQTTYTDPGMIKIGGWPIYNYEQKVYPGKISMTEVLEKSINTGAVFVEKQLGHIAFLNYIERFGIFEKTGIDLQGEGLSPNTEFKKGYEAGFATASFGQGIDMTPVQLARAFCAIANNGKLVQPYIVGKSINEDDEITEYEPKFINESVISSRTASKLTAMLVSVVENGFAKKAQVPRYYIAGKTSTAQIAFSALGIKERGYSDKYIHSFIGFAPAFDPQFLILVKLDNPYGVKTASVSAVPLFQELAKYIIDYYQIPPDYEPETD